jgi:hypothetical protein
MIKFALQCEKGHGFEGWFRSSADFEVQARKRLVECPACASKKIEKALMAPAVQGTDVNLARTEVPVETTPAPVAMPDPRQVALREMMRKMRDYVVANSEDVGDKFAEEARKIHNDEVEKRSIHGRATPDEAHALREDGVEFAPLPVFPDDHN